MFLQIQRPYDSHLHLLGLGEFLSHIDLRGCKSLHFLSGAQSSENSWRGEILIGFGLSHDYFLSKELEESLSVIFKDHGVFFSRQDGHASIVNAKAAELLGLPAQTQRLYEMDHFRALSSLPAYSHEQIKKKLLIAKRYLHKKGFTFFRDMTATLEQIKAWSEIVHQDQDCFIEYFFMLTSIKNLHICIGDLHKAKAYDSKYLQARGVKIFVDGTFGSQTAMSCACSKAITNFSSKEIEQIIEKSWTAGFEVAAHCIGEGAVDLVVESARHIMANGVTGRIHLEHCEVLKFETLKKLKSLHVTVHMQPSHLVGDLETLEKIPKDNCHIFPLINLKNSKVPLFFGSDAPVELPGFSNTAKGLAKLPRCSSKNIALYLQEHHSYLGFNLPQSQVQLDENYEVVALDFEGKALI